MYKIFAQLLVENGLKASDVAKATKITPSTFSDWKKGKSKPNTEKMIKIANYLNVSVEYLTTGKNSVTDFLYSDENAEFLIEIQKKAHNVDFVTRMRKYMDLIESDQKSVDDLIDFLHDKEKKEEAD